MLEKPDPAIPEPSDLPRLSQEELNAALEKHAMFLRGQVGGQRVLLQYKDLSDLNFYNHDLSQSDFTGSSMARADLSLGTYKGACFFACDLRDADLSNTDLSRTDLRGAILSGADLSGANMKGADLREGKIMQKSARGALEDRERNGATGTKTILSGARLNKADLSGVRARSADFSDADMSNANTSDAMLTGASFKGANLSNTDFSGANIMHADLRDSILTNTIMVDTEKFGADYEGAITQDAMGETLENAEKTLEELLEQHSIWVKTTGEKGQQLDLSGYDLRDIRKLRSYILTAVKAVKATFLHLDLSNMQIQSGVLDQSDFRDCDMENIDLRGTRLKNCKLTRANLRGALLSPLKFQTKDKTRLLRCDLSGSDLRYVDFSGADLRDCIMMGVDLSKANLSGADLRRADLTGAILSDTNLKDANISNAIIDFKSI